MAKLNHVPMISRGPVLVFLTITGLSALLVALSALVDFARGGTPLATIFYQSVNNGALAGLPEVIIGVLGVAITVVAIIVELASNRYTARITELFMQSAVNLTVLSLFVITAILCTWMAVISSSGLGVPHLGAMLTLGTVLLCLLLLLPYFAFVFNFLNPHNIVDRMANSVIQAVGHFSSQKNNNLRAKKLAVIGIEQLADVASGAIESKDKVVCMHSVDAICSMVIEYMGVKSRIETPWFSLEPWMRDNPDFVSMQSDVLADIENNHYWLEMKVLRQYQMLYGESLNRMRDINYLLAINTRKIAQAALDAGDDEIVALCIKFFNTYMRATINARDVRTAYNVFNQYRLLAESALAHHKSLLAVDIARRFKYYGQLGFSMGLPFVLETAAYDLGDLNELAFDRQVPCQRQLLDILLEVDKEAEEGHSMEASLRGVRKAQIKLATFFLTKEAVPLARMIFEDMKDELPGRLRSIREEFAQIRARAFWEINDRGVNFDYLDGERRAALETFFGWFGNDKD